MMSPRSEDYWLIGGTDGRKRFESGSVAFHNKIPENLTSPFFQLLGLTLKC